MKNPLNFLKHIVKDPIKTIAEAETRKKEIMPLLYGSVGVIAISVILQTAAKLDFMTIFSFIGFLGAGFCGFLLMIINKAKSRFETLTCDKCNALAEIKTPEDFAKYVSYTVDKEEAKFHGFTGNKKPTDGVYSQVKFSGSASAALAVTLTCPHCGEIKHLRFCADTFKCHAEATRVGALQLAGVSASLENAVKTAVNDYNNPDKKGSIPYTYHSSKNPNFENRYNFKGANGASARPNYLGAIIDYHKDIEEIFEHYFLFNELVGTLIDPNADSKKKAKPKNTEVINTQNISNNDQEQPTANNSETYPVVAPTIDQSKNTESDSGVVTVTPICESDSQFALSSVQETAIKPRNEGKGVNKSIIAIAICAVIVVGGVVFGLTSANKSQNSTENTPTDSVSEQSKTDTSSQTAEKINVNDWVGYWHIENNSEKELTIHSGSSDSVKFSLHYSKKDVIKDVSALLESNVATFSLAIDGSVVKGKLIFQKDEITVSITQSTLETVPVGELKFTQLHMSSVIPDEEEQPENNHTDKTSSNSSSAPSVEPNQDAKPSLKQVPYLFPAEENTYEIYKSPSFQSDYVKMLPKGTFTIVAEEYDAYNNLWGKLKSGVGWICVAENTEK